MPNIINGIIEAGFELELESEPKLTECAPALCSNDLTFGGK